MEIAEISISRKKIKLPKIFILEQHKKKNFDFTAILKCQNCQNAEKIITETENSRIIIIAKISIFQKIRKLPKMFIVEQHKKKEF